MRLSTLMKKILLILLKAEDNPEFVPSRGIKVMMQLELMREMGQISEEEMYAILHKMPAKVSKMQLIRLIRPEAIQKIERPGKVFYSISGSVEVSFTRCLKRLVEMRLINVERERRIFVYSLTEKGRTVAEKIRNEIQFIIQQYQRFI